MLSVAEYNAIYKMLQVFAQSFSAYEFFCSFIGYFRCYISHKDNVYNLLYILHNLSFWCHVIILFCRMSILSNTLTNYTNENKLSEYVFLVSKYRILTLFHACIFCDTARSTEFCGYRVCKCIYLLKLRTKPFVTFHSHALIITLLSNV